MMTSSNGWTIPELDEEFGEGRALRLLHAISERGVCADWEIVEADEGDYAILDELVGGGWVAPATAGLGTLAAAVDGLISLTLEGIKALKEAS